jgi:hypothetical protein
MKNTLIIALALIMLGCGEKSKETIQTLNSNNKNMNTISINGTTISSNGSIVVSNGKIIVDGKDVTPEGKEINLVVAGNVEKLEVDFCTKIAITGDVENVNTKSGDVDITGNVNGSIQTMSGDVDCGNVSGSISTMSGDVKHRK